MSVPAFKTCPKCGQNAVLSMPQCRRCGYVYPKPSLMRFLWIVGIAFVMLFGWLIYSRLTPDVLTAPELLANNLKYNGHEVLVRAQIRYDGPSETYLIAGSHKQIIVTPRPAGDYNDCLVEVRGLYSADLNLIHIDAIRKLEPPPTY